MGSGPKTTGKAAGTATVAGTGTAKVKASKAPSKWTGTKDQEKFRDSVLKAHIKRSTRIKGKKLADLKGSELEKVPGTSVKMKTAAAKAAGKLLAAAEKDLTAIKAKGDADAKKTVGLSATSGYRGEAHQEKLWKRYFKKKYYNNTAAHRASLKDGEHGDPAVQYMVKHVRSKIAAPGFSKHQAGNAIDFKQKRTSGNAIKNSTSKTAVTAWQATWFFKWLEKNATTHKFEEYAKEPWHWIYTP